MKKLVLINGWATSGKDTMADYLVMNHNYKKMQFSYFLKECVSNKYNIDLKLLSSQEGKKKLYSVHDYPEMVSGRKLLIDYAKEARKLNNAFFVEKIIKDINSLKEIKNTKNIVISDFRYPVEYNEIIKHLSNEYLVRTIRINRYKMSPINDPSEIQLETFKFDHIFDNNGRIDNIYNFVDENVDGFL